VHSLKDIIEFNERNKEKEMPYFLQDTFIKAEAKGPLTSKEYLDALEANHRLSRAEASTLSWTNFSWMPSWRRREVRRGSPIWSMAIIPRRQLKRRGRCGYPDITVPAGFISGCRLEFVLRASLERACFVEDCLWGLSRPSRRESHLGFCLL